MKKFFNIYILVVILGLLYICVDFSRYSVGLLNEDGEIVVPITHRFPFEYIDYEKLKVGPLTTNFLNSRVYDEKGFLFETKGIYWAGDENLTFKVGPTAKINAYYKDKLIEKNIKSVGYTTKHLYTLTCKDGSNVLNSQTGEYLLPKKYKEVNFFHNLYQAEDTGIHELYDKTGKKLYSGNLRADDYFKDLIISGNRLYSKEGKLHNNTTLTEYTVFKDNLYAIIDYKPYIYNIEKNTFEETDIDYIRPSKSYQRYIDRCFYVHKKGKFGVIIDDYESPIIYDDIKDLFVKEKACLVIQGNKYGIIGPNTNIPCIYDNISSYLNRYLYGIYIVSKQDHTSQINFPGVKQKYTKPPMTRQDYITPPQQKVIKNYYTAVDRQGKELIPYSDTEMYINKDYIISGDRQNDKTNIYDHKGNKLLTLDFFVETGKGIDDKRINVIFNRLIKINENKYFDIKTQKYYSSINDFIAEINPQTQLPKNFYVYDTEYKCFFYHILVKKSLL